MTSATCANQGEAKIGEGARPESEIRARLVETHFWAKPIPVRQFDWSATLEGYEPDDPIGYGETELDAIRDLAQLIDEGRQ